MTALAPDVIQDPPVPADGSCVVCGRQRRPERSRRYAGFAAETDAFCSMPCARSFYGCDLPRTGKEYDEDDAVAA